MSRLIAVLLVCVCFVLPVQADEAQITNQAETTPMEREDMKSLDELAEPTNQIEDEETPMEEDDVKSIDDINRETEIRD